MRRVLVASWCLTLAACSGRCQREPPDALAAFTRPNLEPFPSDEALTQYLDAASYVLEHSGSSMGATSAPPARTLPPGSGPAVRAMRDMTFSKAGNFYDAENRRLLVRRDSAFVLHKNELIRYAIDPTSKQLSERARLTLSPLRGPKREIVTRPDGTFDYNAYAPNAYDGVNVFDALLDTGSDLIALGSRQDVLAIEIMRISVDVEGALALRDAALVHTNYGADFVGKLAAGALVLGFHHETFFATAPSFRERQHALPAFGVTRDPLLHGRDVYHPLTPLTSPGLNVLVRCPLDAAALRCSAQALLVDAAFMHLADDAAYVWAYGSTEKPTPAVLYRLPFEGSAPSAVRVDGSYLQLHASRDASRLVVAQGEALMLVAGLREAFSPAAAMLPESAYRRLQRTSVQTNHVRFVANYLLLDDDTPNSRGESGYWKYGAASKTTELVRISDLTSTTLDLGHAASSVVELGSSIAVIGSDSWNLWFSLLRANEVVAKQPLRAAVRDWGEFQGTPHVVPSAAGARWLLQPLAPQDTYHQQKTLTYAAAHVAASGSALDAPVVLDVPLTLGTSWHYNCEVAGLADDVIGVHTPSSLVVMRLSQSPEIIQTIALPVP